MLGNSAATATVLKRYFMNPVCMKNDHAGAAGDGVLTEAAGMVQLKLQSYRLKGSRDKMGSSPLLRQQSVWCRWKRSTRASIL